jgi:hypothetical protein
MILTTRKDTLDSNEHSIVSAHMSCEIDVIVKTRLLNNMTGVVKL